MNNKSILIFRIILWSVAALILTGMLVTFITARGFWGNFNSKISWNNKELDTLKENNFDSYDIENINLDWIYGNVYIYPTNEDNISIIEKSSIKEEQLKITINGKTLNMKQQKRKRFFPFFNFGYNQYVIEVMLPEKQYNEIKLKGTSGKLDMNGILANAFDLKITSGKINISKIKGENLIVNATSGQINIAGEFEDINIDITSGSLKLDSNNAPSKMRIDMTSGNSKIAIPENDGFTLYESKTSGSFKTDFEIDDFGVYKNGENKYSFKMTSGSIKLLKKD